LIRFESTRTPHSLISNISELVFCSPDLVKTVGQHSVRSLFQPFGREALSTRLDRGREAHHRRVSIDVRLLEDVRAGSVRDASTGRTSVGYSSSRSCCRHTTALPDFPILDSRFDIWNLSDRCRSLLRCAEVAQNLCVRRPESERGSLVVRHAGGSMNVRIGG